MRHRETAAYSGAVILGAIFVGIGANPKSDIPIEYMIAAWIVLIAVFIIVANRFRP